MRSPIIFCGELCKYANFRFEEVSGNDAYAPGRHETSNLPIRTLPCLDTL